MQQTTRETSRALAEEKGCFPDWENSTYYPDEKIRNATRVTIAPTGSVTTIAGCEGYGIEPIFAVAYKKATNVAGDFEVFSPLFLEACQKAGVPNNVLEEVASKGTCQGVNGIPPEIARVFKGAQDIAPEDHILMQAEVQKYVDNAVSKTINLPNQATIEDVDMCFKMAYELGLKGITIFRDGCKEGTVTIGQGQKDKPREEHTLKRGEILPRPVSTHGVTYRLDTGCGKLYLTVNYQPGNGEIIETFITTGSDGGCLVYTEATSRMISLAIRGGIAVDEIVEQLLSTHSCPAYMLAKGRGRNLSPGKSCASAIAYKIAEIKDMLKKCNGSQGPTEEPIDPSLLCECGAIMERAEGCFVCRNCGYSKC
jgi:ribonucleoside-diphosphate reductase alpha chain